MSYGFVPPGMGDKRDCRFDRRGASVALRKRRAFKERISVSKEQQHKLGHFVCAPASTACHFHADSFRRSELWYQHHNLRRWRTKCA